MRQLGVVAQTDGQGISRKFGQKLGRFRYGIEGNRLDQQLSKSYLHQRDHTNVAMTDALLAGRIRLPLQ